MQFKIFIQQYITIYTNMRSLRNKKLKNETQKYLHGPYDQSLIQIQLDKNEKCIQELSNDNFDNVNELIKQIKSDTEMISSYNRQKYIIKSLSLNTQAYYYLKQRNYQSALKCLDQAQQLEKDVQSAPMYAARTKLNKSVVLSHLDKNQQAIQLGKEALQLLKRRQMQYFQLRKNQYKLYEIMTVSFYNIAVKLSHISDNIEASKVYKQGFYLAQKTLGPHHKLTLLLKNIVKKEKDLSKSRQKIKMSSIDMNKSGNKIFQTVQSYLIPSTLKQKQLERIYASRRKSHTVSIKESKKQIDYYLKSLEKIRRTYSKNKKRDEHLYTQKGDSDIQKYSGIKIARRFMTQSQKPGQRQVKPEHKKIKDIILDGSSTNKNLYFANPVHLKDKKSNSEQSKKNIKINKIKESILLQPIAPLKTTEKELKLADITKKVQQKREEDHKFCKLI